MINKLNVTEILSHLVKSPLISMLAIPITLIYCATKSIQAQIFFGVIGVISIIFAGWVIKQFIVNGIGI